MSTKVQLAAAGAVPPTLVGITSVITPITVGTTQSAVIDLGMMAAPNFDSAYYTFHLVVATANLDQTCYIVFGPSNMGSVTATNGFPLPKNHLYERICSTGVSSHFRVIGTGAAMGTLYVHRSSLL